MNREAVISKLKERPILNEGSRNDDAANLAIVAYADAGGEIANSTQLMSRIQDLIEDEKIPTNDETDLIYLTDKVAILCRYLSDWYDTGDIYAYAII